MGMFLNSSALYEGYKEVRIDKYFVDKSMLIDELIPALGIKNRYFCITRPRRFGKTVMANMVGAFFSKAQDASEMFEGLAIANTKKFETHLNSHDVIYIDFSRVPRDCKSYSQYIKRIQDGINQDLAEAYPDLNVDVNESVWDILQRIFEKSRNKFVFVIDEWDAVFHMPFISSDEQKEYLLFLRNLLKDQAYVELAYMTGVLPIAKYSSGSELNMFVEYDMVTSEKFSEYFGFSDTEVDELYETYKSTAKNQKISRDDLRIWYDGYYNINGNRIYNPRSVVLALSDNQLRSYWTSSGPYDEIFYYIKNNIENIREDLVLLVSGEGIETEIDNFAAVSMQLDTKDEIYSAMVVYGLLTYDDGKVYIPNREIMEQFLSVTKRCRLHYCEIEEL